MSKETTPPGPHKESFEQWQARLFNEQPLLKKLEKKLLRFGGSGVAIMREHHLERLLKHGALMRAARALVVEGEPNQCHHNAGRYWLGDTERRKIVTGYYLFDGHGDCWRQHSWVVEGGRLVECTTKEPAKFYFGVELSPSEAGRFAASNVFEIISFFEHFQRHDGFKDELEVAAKS